MLNFCYKVSIHNLSSLIIKICLTIQSLRYLPTGIINLILLRKLSLKIVYN